MTVSGPGLAPVGGTGVFTAARDVDRALCRFGTDLAPGRAYVLDKASLRIRPTEKHNSAYEAFALTPEDAQDKGFFDIPGTWGTSGTLKLVKAPGARALGAPATDPDHYNNAAWGDAIVTAAVPPASPSASASPSVPPATGGDTGGTGGGLPVTGLPIGVIAATGGVLVLLGGLGAWSARRRRGARFVA